MHCRVLDLTAAALTKDGAQNRLGTALSTPLVQQSACDIILITQGVPVLDHHQAPKNRSVDG